jgi:hypothetical protein
VIARNCGEYVTNERRQRDALPVLLTELTVCVLDKTWYPVGWFNLVQVNLTSAQKLKHVGRRLEGAPFAFSRFTHSGENVCG